MRINKRLKDIKYFTYRSLTFFLFATLFLNLVGNLVAISWQYTFYFLGYNSVALASRFIENTIFNISGRVLLLGLAALFASGVMYFIYYYAKREKKFFLILGIVLYVLDFSLSFHAAYLEGPKDKLISNYIHLTFLLLFFVFITAYFYVRPTMRGYYDHA